jgi:succinate dehydrogenase / fumarate reductase, cytochrome b subunit
MAVSRNAGLQGLRYRGGGLMLTWLLHRVSGLGMILFVTSHVVAAFLLQRFGSNLTTAFNTVYESWPFQLFIYFCVIFHALNGLRIIILDFWPQLLQYEHEAAWLQWLTFGTIYGLTVFLMVMRAISGG